MVHVINSMKRLSQFIDFSIALMIYICLYSLTHKGQGSGGYFTDENDLASYVITILPFSYYLFFQAKGKGRIFYGFALIVGLMSIVTSLSRGGFLGFVAMAGVIWLSSKNKITTLIICGLLGVGLSTQSPDHYLLFS